MRIINLDAGGAGLQYRSEPGAIPRRTTYGNEPGLIPFSDFPDRLVDPRDYKERIASLTQAEAFPMHHQGRWLALLPAGERWTQSRLNYCWAWGLAAAIMDNMAASRPDHELALLSPVSLGHAVGWRNRGNYLADAIRTAKETGICTRRFTPDPHSRDPRTFADHWQVDAYQNRLVQAYDLDNATPKRMIQSVVSAFSFGSSIYVAYDYWRHALNLAGLIWDETKPNNLIFVLRNSHNEKDPLHLVGRRAIPSEAYAVQAASAPRQATAAAITPTVVA